MSIPFAVMTDSSEDMRGLQYLHKHLSSSEAELVLRSRQFSLNLTMGASDKAPENFEISLTNGKLLQTSSAGSSPDSRERCEYIMDNAISCHISIIGWNATYDGEMKHANLGSEKFRVTIILQKYDLPLNPADIWIYMKFADTSLGRYTSTTPSDFLLNMSTLPPLTQLGVLQKNGLSESAWDKLKKIMYWNLKTDLIHAMITKYKEWVEKEIRY